MWIRWCFGWQSIIWSPWAWGPSPGRHWGGSSRWWCGKKKKKRVLMLFGIFEWGTKKGCLEFSVACLSIMFFAVKSWNFVGLICLLFAGRGFKNCSGNWNGQYQPLNYLKEEREALLFVSASPVGWGGLVYGAYWWHSLVPGTESHGSHSQWSVQSGVGSVQVSQCLPDHFVGLQYCDDGAILRVDLTRDR